mgnify:CR=1 FL=1
MKKPIHIKVKTKYASKFKKGYPLIEKEAIENNRLLVDEGQLFNLVDDRNVFIGLGYYGLQNKGIGWVISQTENATINKDFFVLLLIKEKHYLQMNKQPLSVFLMVKVMVLAASRLIIMMAFI